MKLIIKEYLASLKERDELDAVLPDLLSQLGLNVYSRPARGTRQDVLTLERSEAWMVVRRRFIFSRSSRAILRGGAGTETPSNRSVRR